MMRRLAVLTLSTALLAACETSAVDPPADPDEPPPPPATPPAPSPTVQPLPPAGTASVPHLGPTAPSGSNPILVAIDAPSLPSGALRGTVTVVPPRA
ncbi:MAG: hypothetical protein AAGG65_16745 [Pseudomonadota bacterium]